MTTSSRFLNNTTTMESRSNNELPRNSTWFLSPGSSGSSPYAKPENPLSLASLPTPTDSSWASRPRVTQTVYDPTVTFVVEVTSTMGNQLPTGTSIVQNSPSNTAKATSTLIPTPTPIKEGNRTVVVSATTITCSVLVAMALLAIWLVRKKVCREGNIDDEEMQLATANRPVGQTARSTAPLGRSVREAKHSVGEQPAVFSGSTRGVHNLWDLGTPVIVADEVPPRHPSPTTSRRSDSPEEYYRAHRR